MMTGTVWKDTVWKDVWKAVWAKPTAVGPFTDGPYFTLKMGRNITYIKKL
jgi:hypothetical protein